MVKIRVDLMIKLQQFPVLPYRWSKNPLRRNGNNYLTWNSQLRRNGNKPVLVTSLQSEGPLVRFLFETYIFILNFFACFSFFTAP